MYLVLSWDVLPFCSNELLLYSDAGLLLPLTVGSSMYDSEISRDGIGRCLENCPSATKWVSFEMQVIFYGFSKEHNI